MSATVTTQVLRIQCFYGIFTLKSKLTPKQVLNVLIIVIQVYYYHTLCDIFESLQS